MQLKVKSVGNTNPSGRGMNGNVFDSDYLCPTLTTNKGEGIKILIKNATKKGYLIAEEGDGIDTAYPESKTSRGRVQRNMAHTLTTDDSKCVVIGASRGRDPKNPSDRKAGNSNLQQRLEINKNGTSNTITTVHKDNLVVEGVDVHTFSKKMEFGGYKQKEVSKCLLATDYKAPKTILESQTNDLRIRKLTPKECWRLMGISDEDFDKAQGVNSNTQLYKQAGNAIVVNVLEAIFKQMFLK